MAEFFVVQDGFLVSHGFAPDGSEHLQQQPGQSVVIGAVPGYEQQAVPHVGGRWHVDKQCWVDGRTDEERLVQAQADVMAKRRAAYPPLEDLADALYWQAMGDQSKMIDYLTACRMTKELIPKTPQI